ncbi:hypothetical protein ACFXNW_17445 [Nocardia sp. NPDC059180]|uniref:hypothetical protein n=1 Tax=Nocardia sp. NPDC059180 TaxID=3346761 RepID=UPI00369FE744
MKSLSLRAAALIGAVVPAAVLLSGTAVAGPAAADSQAAVVREVDKTGWYGGFAITVDEVSAKEADSGATEVEVKLGYENLIGATLAPPDKAYLEVDGGEVVDLRFDSKKIAGYGKGKGTATGTLGTTDGSLDDVLDDVVLVYGKTDGNLTKIPFAQKEKVESIEPKGISVGQTIGSNPVAVTLSKAFLWPSYEPGEKGKYELWVETDLALSADYKGYGYNVYPKNFTVTSPSGETDSADKRSSFYSELLTNGGSIEGEWLVFLIDGPAKGDYRFDVDMNSTPTSDKSKVDLTTTIAL